MKTLAEELNQVREGDIIYIFTNTPEDRHMVVSELVKRVIRKGATSYFILSRPNGIERKVRAKNLPLNSQVLVINDSKLVTRNTKGFEWNLK